MHSGKNVNRILNTANIKQEEHVGKLACGFSLCKILLGLFLGKKNIRKETNKIEANSS